MNPPKKKFSGERPPKSRLIKALRFVQAQLTTLHHRKRRLQRRIKNRSKTGKPHGLDLFIASVDLAIKFKLPYVLGGGHVTPAPQPEALAAAHSGYDCSSGACHFDQDAGVKTQTGTTWTMAEPQAGLAKGPGRYVTHFIKNNSGDDQHVISRLTDASGKVLGWAQVGGNDNPTAGGGACWFNPTKSRIAEFYDQVHPEGM